MKKFYASALLFFVAFLAHAQDPFVTTWQVTADDLSITVPILPDDFDNSPNNYTIDFGDGAVLTNQSLMATHTYSAPGIYTVTISGTYDRIQLSFVSGSSYKLKTIEQWGDNQWTTMYGAFGGGINLTISATDVPDLSQVTNMSYMFGGCTILNSPLNNWDVSNVTSMEGTFFGAEAFNQPLDNWDVSNVLTMQEMFAQAYSFNQPIGNWDVSSVFNMQRMFTYTNAFNQPLDDWDVSNVFNMWEIFARAYAFNQDLNSWNLSSVQDISRMFIDATAFNGNIADWDVSHFTNLEYMFSGSGFNGSLNNWDVSNVHSMVGMFYNAPVFNQPLDNWDISSLAAAADMFGYADAFNQDLSAWSFSHPDIVLHDFLEYSGMDTTNYDALLLRFAQLGLEGKQLVSSGLHYCDTGVHNYLVNVLDWEINGDSVAASCQGNTVAGTISLDENGNGCDTNDVTVHNFMVNAANGPFNYSVSSAENGTYSLKVQDGGYEVQLLNLPSYFTAAPATSNVSFTGFGNSQTLNFCLTANEAINDLNITLLPITEARPGFEGTYQLVASNMGTQTVSNAMVNLSYDVAAQTFVSASETSNTATTGQLGFTIPTLQPFETAVIDIVMQTFTPPTVNGDDSLEFTATITPDAGDHTPGDNTFEFAQTVVNSFDPNDKRVVQGSEIFMEQADEYLDYIIRFQNTGTASAITVRVEDELSEMLDWTTFTPLSASHYYTVRITEGNKVEFLFNNINLPAQQDDNAGSNGYIAYKIKPVQDVTIGDIITGNEASIFFDFNLPIITNAVTTEVVSPTAGISGFDLNAAISIYPNPATDVLHLQPENGILILDVKIYNLQGRELLSSALNPESINLSSLNTGIYLLTVKTTEGMIQRRIIKN